MAFLGKLPSVTKEQVDLSNPRLKLEGFETLKPTSRGKGGVRMAVAARPLLKLIKLVGQNLPAHDTLKVLPKVLPASTEAASYLPFSLLYTKL